MEFLFVQCLRYTHATCVPFFGSEGETLSKAWQFEKALKPEDVGLIELVNLLKTYPLALL